jgi:hypothetical protein
MVSRGWLDETNVAGERLSVPWLAESEIKQAMDSQAGQLEVYTGDAFMDAANIFLNQLALTAFNNLLESLGSDQPNYTSSYSGDYGGFSNEQAQGSQGGAEDIKQRFNKIASPNFNERGDYEILGELTRCPDPQNAGPTECVITDKFREAVSGKMTVAEAMEKGYLDENGVFAYRSGEKLQPKYNEGYPYRAMIILRKYRIIPVGWELAGQYIGSNFSDIGGVKSLGDMVACYDSGDGYEGYNENWCEGLVDPNWVLKAPANYCGREGPGPMIQTEQVTGQGEDSKLNISRKDNYCADEQTCIKEGNDDSCEYYGYCLQERRQWDFEADSCDPKYNTCQTFSSSQGGTVSYLENTLNYSICRVDNAGCKKYAAGEGASYEMEKDEVGWEDSDNSLYFDRDVEQCSSGQEGCHGFIRTVPGTGSNLLIDSGFENSSGQWSGYGSITFDDSYFGDSALELSSEFIKNVQITPAQGYEKKGDRYTFSFYAKNCSGEYGLVNTDGHELSSMNGGDGWQRYTYSHAFNSSGNGITIKINPDSSCIVDGLKLERGGSATGYSDYRQAGLIYEKLLPEYLHSTCYGEGSYQYQEEAPAVCYNFARKCNQDEVGCNRYTSEKDGFKITAKTSAQNVCPAECNGYDTYFQQETDFEADPSEKYFIPATAQTCGANVAGCSQFTNLDKLEQGAEAIEYYSELRQCVQPDDPAVSCTEFYTWQGGEGGEKQLVYYQLKTDGNSPATINSGAGECNEDIYNASPMDNDYNPDCMKFYDQNGEEHYELYSNTISCSDNCHPYRKTNSVGMANCHNTGGTWNNEQNACIYHAIPGEGKRCGAEEAGCRQYNGDRANNIRLAAVYDFEGGSTQGWDGGNISTESLIPSDSSLQLSNEASVNVSDEVSKGNSYTLRILAMGNSNNIQIYFDNGDEEDDNQKIYFDTASADFEDPSESSSVTIFSGWRVYEVSWHNLKHSITADEELVIENGDGVYMDSARLIEMPDSYYLIEDSWGTPDSCNKDIYGNDEPLYMLGCERYQDQNGGAHYLHDFEAMCPNMAVGCELMKDTQNSKDYSDDNYLYMTYDSSKECSAGEKGCERLGEVYEYSHEGSDINLYQDVYLENNPDEYDSIVCSPKAVGCQEWGGENGYSYFKDPGDEVCAWKKPGENPWGWYKKEIKKCKNNSTGNFGSICLSDSDCGEGESCATFTYKGNSGFYNCPTDEGGEPKTLGRGGERIVQPGDGWAGLCPASQSGCTEYIDPYSKLNPNLLNSQYPETQVSIEPHTAYYYSSANFPASPAKNISSHVFHYYGDEGQDEDFDGDSLRKAVVDYRLEQEVNKSDCNGLYNFNDGCILFNERSVVGGDENGISYKSLDYDSIQTHEDYKNNPTQGVTPVSGNNDSNQLLKVRPDRTCSTWLACTTYTKDESGKKTCYNVGECSGMDENGNCDQFQAHPYPPNITYDPNFPSLTSAIKQLSLTGYYKVGYKDTGYHKVPNNLYPLGGMDQVGESTVVPNGSFELRSEDDYPIGWVPIDGTTWEKNYFSVIDNPISAQEEGVDYPVEGKNFLKYSSEEFANSPFSEFIDIEPGQKYVLSADINTLNLISAESNKEVGMILGILPYDSNGDALGEGDIDTPPYPSWSGSVNNPLGTDWVVISSESGRHWTEKVGEFKTSSKVDKIRIVATAYGVSDNNLCGDAGLDYCRGNIYIDNIKIKPALEIKTEEPENYKARQTCRLYPQNDSLSCEYYEDSGKKQKGQYGYCLEYDRSPGNSDTCLLWWPVDMVEGQGIEEGAGYDGRSPVYYCTDIKKTTGAVKIHCEENLGAGPGADCEWSPSETNHGPYGWDENYMIYKVEDHYVGLDQPGYDLDINWPSIMGEDGCDPYAVYAAPDLNSEWSFLGNVAGEGVGGTACPHDGGAHIASYDLSYAKNNSKRVGPDRYVNSNPYYGVVKYLRFVKYKTNPEHHPSQDTPYPKFLNPGFYCNEITRTVTPSGRNKYWSARVSEGSQYSYTCNKGLGLSTTCSYLTDYKPYGSAVSPAETFAELTNPFTWDSKPDQSGKQPLYYEHPNTELEEPYQTRMGRLQDKENLKRIFAQSYGVWRWEDEGVLEEGDFSNVNVIANYGSDILILTDWNWYMLEGDGGGWMSPNDFDSSFSDQADREASSFFEYFANYDACGPISSHALVSAISRTYNGNEYIVFFDGGKFYILNITQKRWEPASGFPASGLNLSDRNISTLFESFTDHGTHAPSSDSYSAIRSGLDVSDNWVFTDNQKVYYMSWTNRQWISADIGSTFNTFKNKENSPQNYNNITGSYYNDTDKAYAFLDEHKLYSLSFKGMDANNNNEIWAWNPPQNLDGVYFGINNSPQKVGEVTHEGAYIRQDGAGWGPPDSLCGNGSRPKEQSEQSNDWCGIPPEIKNIQVNGKKTGTVHIDRTGFVNLTFNSEVDSQQLPLTTIYIDWGDGNTATISGAEMRDRRNEDNPHSFYHLYSYQDLKAKKLSTNVKPKIKIQDNWGWCNDDSSRGSCDSWEPFLGTISVMD